MVNFRVAVSVKRSKSVTYKVPWWIRCILKAAVYVVGCYRDWNTATLRWCSVGGGGSALNGQVFHTTEHTISAWVISRLSCFLYIKSFLRFMNSFPFPATGDSVSLIIRLFLCLLMIIESKTCILSCLPLVFVYLRSRGEIWLILTRFSLHIIIKMGHSVGFVAVKLLTMANLIC